MQTNFEQEHQKVEAMAKTLIGMINNYKKKLQEQFQEYHVKESRNIGQHIKDISQKKEEAKEIMSKLDMLSKQLDTIRED